MKTIYLFSALISCGALSASRLPEINIVATSLCKGDQTQFSVSPMLPGSTVFWNFGDGQTADGPAPQHIFALAGNYNVSATINYSGTIIVRRKQITIYAVPVIAAPVYNRNICTTGTVQFLLSQYDATLLGSQSAATFGVAYFTSPENLLANTNAVTALSYGQVMVYAKVFNHANPACYARTNFRIGIFRSPEIGVPPPLIQCDTNGDGTELFDLVLQSAIVLGTQSAADYLVTYHLTQDDATVGENALPAHYSNVANPQTVFARIESRANRTCCRTAPFELRLLKNTQCMLRP